jgi:hypothetical protein
MLTGNIVPLDFGKEVREITNRCRNGPEMVGLELDGLAKAWINDCARSHPLCPKPQDAILPTRLLDVGDSTESLEGLHLVVPGKVTKGKWIALSYCWGKNNETYQTTTKNLEDHLRQIPVEKLPLTIQDAVHVTRSLDIRYLWVDALCIIQDSDEDWQAEAAKMMNVYGNAYATIAANTGGNANSGLYIDRNLLESRPCEMKFREPDGKKLVRYRWIHPPRMPWGTVVKSGNLQKRGWALQETCIAVRVIYYDENGLFWQCRQGIRQERVPSYLIRANDPLAPRRIFDSFADDPMNIFTLWADLVQEYTARNLTFEYDKLFAIAGVASAVAAYIKSRSDRRLANAEEKKLYSIPEILRHWAVPANPEATDRMRHDGANSSFRWMLTDEELATGRPTYTYTKGPLSMDPFLTIRHFGGLDREADKEFAHPSDRTKEIMTSVGLGPLLKFVSNTENPDYDDEYTHLMSHPDTHAAYYRAYRLWKAEKDKRGIEGEASTSATGKEHETDNGNEGKSVVSGEVEDTVENSSQSSQHKDDFLDCTATDPGLHLDADMETDIPTPIRTNMYVYSDTDPVKARVEWPGYVTDDQYLAGVWKADLCYQLRWYCVRPGRRPVKYRAPSWSWASVDEARIAFDRDKRAYGRSEKGNWSDSWHPRILEAVVVPRGANRFGDAKSAKLTLLAPIRNMPFYAELDIEPSPKQVADSDSLVVPKSELLKTLPDPSREHLHLDEEFARLDPSLKILRLDSSSCLIVEPIGYSQEPQVLKRVGYWVCKNQGFDTPKGTKGLGDWDIKVVILI